MLSVSCYRFHQADIEQLHHVRPGAIKERRVNAYNDNGWLTALDMYDAANTKTQSVTYTKHDALGNVRNYQVAVLTGTAYTNYYAYTYAAFDGYKESVVAGSSSYFQPGNTTSTYDANGNLVKVVDKFNTDKTRDFINNAAGQVLKKTENGKTQHYFYANYQPVGSSGALSAVDFDYNYTAVSDSYPASAPGSYVVSAGDTLQSIALAVFGDARLWYLIADANGLSNDQDLVAGRNLTIPNKITNLHNDYKTFKPYSAGNIIGDTTPTLPDPPPPPPVGGDDGCGGLGAILVIIVVIVVAAVTQQYYLMSVTNTTTAVAATAAATTSQVAASLVVGAMVGNVAGQMVGIAAGIQDEFSWEAVAVSGITAGITQGLGLNAPGLKGLELVQQAAAKSIISQGVNIALGQQDGFSWKAVAVAAIAAPVADMVGKAVGRAIGGALGEAIESGAMAEARPFAQDFGARLASGVVTQVVSQVVYGGGKLNWAQVAADAFGNAIAESIKTSFNQSGQQGVEALAEAEAQAEPSSRGLTMPRNFSLTPDLDKIANEVTMEVALQSASDDPAQPPGPTQAEMLREQEEGLTWGSHAVGREGRRGLWGVAEMIAGPGASNATINDTKNMLIAQNPAIGNWNLREGMTVNWDLSGPGDARRAAELDANYQAVMAQRATEAALAEQAQMAANEPGATTPFPLGGSPALEPENLYTPTGSYVGDAYRSAYRETLNSNNTPWERAGYGALTLLSAGGALLNDIAVGIWNGPNDIYVGAQKGTLGVHTGDPYQFANGLMQASVGVLSVATTGALFKQGLAANAAATEYAVYNQTARASYTGGVANGTTRETVFAKSSQIESGYSADVWGTTSLSKGDIVYALSPTKSPQFFTDLNTLQAVRFDTVAVSEALQVKPHSIYGYRPDVTGYRVTQDLAVPSGTTAANSGFGPGGGTQFFIRNSENYLEPISTINLRPR